MYTRKLFLFAATQTRRKKQSNGIYRSDSVNARDCLRKRHRENIIKMPKTISAKLIWTKWFSIGNNGEV